ncbi:hypothetical protein [Streptomyces chartreusis]|uniref:hypothetical protein n=1 Tax=Streptomyces chartreusis TaxID=1969 RepID=UPI003659E3EA
MATALATGAAAAFTDMPGGIVHDLHAALREAIGARLVSGGGGVLGGYGVRVLDAYNTDPDVWRTRLVQVLATGMEMDEEVLGMARAVLRAERRAGNTSEDAGSR